MILLMLEFQQELQSFWGWPRPRERSIGNKRAQK